MKPKRLNNSTTPKGNQPQQTKAIHFWTFVFLSFFNQTTNSAANTQASSISALPGLIRRSKVSLDRKAFCCWLRRSPSNKYEITVFKKGTNQTISVPISHRPIYHTLITNTDFVMVSFHWSSPGGISKYTYTESTSTLVRWYKPTQGTDKVSLLMEIAESVPHIYCSGGQGEFFLIDYTKDTGEMMAGFTKFTLDTGTPRAIGLAFNHKPEIKIVGVSFNYYLVRFGYNTVGGNALELEASVKMPFNILELTGIKNSDYFFGMDKGNQELYIFNALGPRMGILL